jgi:glutathione peroxidase
VYELEAVRIDGRPERLARYRGQVVLVVNVASRCGFTPQYAALEALYRRHRDAGFVVLAFPCNQFGDQEPGTADEIRVFCAETYDVTFPLFDRIEVKGPNAHPLFRWLTAEKPGLLGSRAIKWNFTKFLVSRTGAVLGRYGPRVPPEAIEGDVTAALAEEAPARPG